MDVRKYFRNAKIWKSIWLKRKITHFDSFEGLNGRLSMDPHCPVLGEADVKWH